MKRLAGSASMVSALAAMLLTLSVAWRALGGFFYSDDLVHLQQAAGLLPTPPIPWRLPSQVGYFRAMLAAFGPHPMPFLIANVLAHLACVAGVVAIARRLGAGGAGATLAGTLFGACPLFLPVLMHAVSVNEWMSGAAWIAAYLLATRSPRPRVGAATVAFVFGVLAKESIVALPLVLLVTRPEGESWRDAARRMRPLLVAMAVGLAAFAVSRAVGLAPSGPTYAMRPQTALVQLATYTRWTLTWTDALPDRVRVPDPSALVPGLALLLVIAAFALGRGDAARRVRVGMAWWVFGLGPVLLLERSTYGHYAYVPFAGLALAVAAAAERALTAVIGLASARSRRAPASGASPRWPRRVVGTTLALAAVACTANADGLMLGRLSAVTADGEWPRDATLRGMELIRRSVTSVMETAEPDDRRLVIFGLSAFQTRYGARSGRLFGAEGGPAYDLLSASLDGGRALRLFVPGLQSVVFVDDALPSDTGATLYVRDAGERLERMGRGGEARDRLRRWIESQGTPIGLRGVVRGDTTSGDSSTPR